MKKNIVVVGSVFIDIKGYPLGEFIPDGRNSGRMEIIHGGVGRNIAEDISRLGYGSMFVSLVDKSPIASDVVRRLEKNGVDTRFVVPADFGMGTWMAIFDSYRDVAASISIRSDMSPLSEIIDKYREDIFCNADGIIVELDLDEPIIRSVFRHAERYGVKVYSAVSVMSELIGRMDYISRSECFICNEQEAGMLLGRDLISPSIDDKDWISEIHVSIDELLRKLSVPKLIVTLGSKGSISGEIINEGCRITYYCQAKPVKVVDTTGAGDSFCAGAVTALVSGNSLKDSCEIGNVVASSVIQSTENVCDRC